MPNLTIRIAAVMALPLLLSACVGATSTTTGGPVVSKLSDGGVEVKVP